MTLKDFFRENNKCALAFSGGVDSAFLLWAAREHGADVTAYFAKTPFQPEFEIRDAERMAKQLGARFCIVSPDPLADENIRKNTPERCYHCKRAIFGEIIAKARCAGYETILDGTNASDDELDRPGMRALHELGVRSPLRECGITKTELRKLSRKAGLFTADKPAYACLATRIPTGTEITRELLERVENGESALMQLGFSDFRLRLRGGAALLQLTARDMELAFKKHREIISALSENFEEIYLDLSERTASV